MGAVLTDGAAHGGKASGCCVARTTAPQTATTASDPKPPRAPSSVRRFCLPFGIDCTMNDEEQTLSNLLRNPWNFMKFCPQFDGAQLRVLLVAKWFGCKYHFDRYLKLPKDKLDFLCYPWEWMLFSAFQLDLVLPIVLFLRNSTGRQSRLYNYGTYLPDHMDVKNKIFTAAFSK